MQQKTLRRTLIGSAVAAAIAVSIALSFREQPLPVETAVVAEGEFARAVRVSGVTRVRTRYLVSAPVNGRLARIDLRPGARVEPGTGLARINPPPSPLLDARTQRELRARLGAAEANAKLAEATEAQAQAAFSQAESERKRLEQLAGSGAVAERDLDRVRTEASLRRKELDAASFRIDAAKHEVQMTRAALRSGEAGAGAQRTVIASPVSGVVLRVFKDTEAFVAVGTPLLELADPADMEVVADVLSNDAVEIDAGDPALLIGWGGPDLAGRVRTVEPGATTKISALGVEEQRVNVVIDILAPYDQWRRLGDNYDIAAAIEVARLPKAVLVDSGALFRDGKTWAVFAVEGGRAAKRTLKVLDRNPELAAVSQGLAVGDEVVLFPGDTLKPGARVDALR